MSGLHYQKVHQIFEKQQTMILFYRTVFLSISYKIWSLIGFLYVELRKQFIQEISLNEMIIKIKTPAPGHA